MPKKGGKKDAGPSKADLIRQRDELIEGSKHLVQHLESLTEKAEGHSRSKAELVMSLAEIEVELSELRANNASRLAASHGRFSERKRGLEVQAMQLSGQVNALSVNLNAGKDALEEVARLKAEVEAKQSLLESEQRQNGAAEALLEKNAFQVGMQLAECSESFLHSVKDQYQGKSGKVMLDKSTVAATDNMGLAKKLTATSEKVSGVLGVYDKGDSKMTLLRRERDFLEGNVGLLETKVLEMTRKLQDYRLVEKETRRQLEEERGVKTRAEAEAAAEAAADREAAVKAEAARGLLEKEEREFQKLKNSQIKQQHWPYPPQQQQEQQQAVGLSEALELARVSKERALEVARLLVEEFRAMKVKNVEKERSEKQEEAKQEAKQGRDLEVETEPERKNVIFSQDRKVLQGKGGVLGGNGHEEEEEEEDDVEALMRIFSGNSSSSAATNPTTNLFGCSASSSTSSSTSLSSLLPLTPAPAAAAASAAPLDQSSKPKQAGFEFDYGRFDKADLDSIWRQ